MKFSLIIIMYGEASQFEMMWRSLSYINYDTNDFEIVLVDDGSVPRIKDAFDNSEYSNVHWLYLERGECSSRSRARNAGAKKARGEFLIFVDGDQAIAPNLILQYDRYFSQNPERQVVLGKRHFCKPFAVEKLFTCFAEGKNLSSRFYLEETRNYLLRAINKPFIEHLGKWHFFWTCNFSIQSHLFHDVGGFDEGFIGWGIEDIEFGYRLSKREQHYDLIDNPVWQLSGEQVITPEKYQDWLKNFQMFYEKYRDVEIMEEYKFDDIMYRAAFSPNEPHLNWVARFIEVEKKLCYMRTLIHYTVPMSTVKDT